MVKSLIQLG